MLASDVVVDLNMLDVFVEDIIMSNVDSTTIVQGSLLYIIIYTSIYRLFSLSFSLYIVNRINDVILVLSQSNSTTNNSH